MEPRGILLAKRSIGFGDADEIDIRVRGQLVQEAHDVIMVQSNNSDADVSRVLRRSRSKRERTKDKEADEGFKDATERGGHRCRPVYLSDRK
ncbi:hypothetical protein GCM10011585_01110 [Edaphobacter dinghuensis]|uniref:Uncharacterized protein n=1 Tax=Edaphobacter dinghuensis TaxID=1560005 RepID=A0A917LX27_9BACT|nr:hypothetical protein GCM10011585_01110 [Edaphobacter dinghuensis]